LEELVNKNSKDMKMQFTFKVDSKGYDFLISKDQTNIQLFDDTKLEDLVFKRDTILLPSSRSGLLQTYLLIEAERKNTNYNTTDLRTGLTDTLRK
jgi:hypothetical protein